MTAESSRSSALEYDSQFPGNSVPYFFTFLSARIIRGICSSTLFSAKVNSSTGFRIDCPAHTPKRNIQRNRQKTTSPIPPTALRLNSNFSFFTVRRRWVAIIIYPYYMRSGAFRPIIRKALRKTTRMACTRARRAPVSAVSSVRTLCLL